MNNSTYYENQILEAIETIVQKKLADANYDTTIKAVIIEKTNSALGEYKAKYQESELVIYSTDPSINYPKGTLVNVVIPNGDFSQTKVIISAVEKDKVEYVAAVEVEDEYDTIGGNSIAATQTYGLCSYKESDMRILYNRDAEVNDINFDATTFANYIKDSNNILCGATFQTELDEIQQKQGNFGIVFEIDFKDNLTGDIVIKNYVVDINNMSGNPYKQAAATRQYNIFEINAENFESVRQIYIFSKNFPNISSEITKNDIFVSNFELIASKKIESDSNGYTLILNVGNKNYFDASDEDTDAVGVKAELKNISDSSIKYYWFRANNNITSDSDEYAIYGGEGWECINNYNTYKDNNGNLKRLWVTSENNVVIKKSDVTTEELVIRCVAVKNEDAVAEASAKVYNYAAAHKITIESDSGTQFYYDNGYPTLTVKVDGVESNSYTYKWAVVKNGGVYESLDETTDANSEYNAAAAGYALLQARIETQTAMPAASQSELDGYKSIIDKYNTIQRVEGNKIYKINMTNYEGISTFKCSVYQDSIMIGTAELALTNTLAIEGDYHLEIINGTQTFKYSTKGISPASETLEKPIVIEPLSFRIIDNLGNELGQTILENCNIKWTVPTENTMLIAEDGTGLTLDYAIAENYDKDKLNNNTIKLSVQYKELNVNAETAFTFCKDGEPGNNGTDIICKIVPNTDEEFDEYPMILNGTLNFTPAAADKWFKIQLWQSGELVWEGTDSEGNVKVTWSVLKNNYTNTIVDPTTITINENKFSYSGYNADAANIVKGTVIYNGLNYYCTIPIITATCSDGYDIKLVKNSGFRYVMYSSAGKEPQYDNVKPFEIKVNKEIDGYIENVSTIDNDYKIAYNWNVRGRIHNGAIWVNDIHLTEKEDADLARNQKFYIPSDNYDGENVSIALEVKMTDTNSTEIGKIHIPIHFYLNKYGIAALNDWDGNKITLDDKNGAILAPQVGAGTKNSANQFTGVLMGSVKEQGSSSADQGLFGYNAGTRTIFLDAKTGKAQFGKSGAGQITIDPSTNTARLYSGNYSTANKTGMLIDLTTPEIRFGSGNFIVDKDGKITATNGNFSGSISASTITGTSINNGNGTFSVDANGNLVAASGKIAGYTISGAQLIGNNVGLSGLSGQGWAFWAGSNTAGSAPFRVGHSGELYATNATITGTISGSTITGSTISGGRVSGSTISGGSINISRSPYYFNMGVYTGNPNCSGLNVGAYGIKASSDVVATGFGITDSDTGKTLSVNIYDGHGQVHYFTFTGGILTKWEYK